MGQGGIFDKPAFVHAEGSLQSSKKQLRRNSLASGHISPAGTRNERKDINAVLIFRYLSMERLDLFNNTVSCQVSQNA
jgi:hypothetical protein